MRVVHHARPAVCVLVETQRGGITGKGHGSRRPWHDTRARYSLCRAALRAIQCPTTGAHSHSATTLPADIGGGEERHPHQPAGHQPDPASRHQAEHHDTDGRRRPTDSGRRTARAAVPGSSVDRSAPAWVLRRQG